MTPPGLVVDCLPNMNKFLGQSPKLKNNNNNENKNSEYSGMPCGSSHLHIHLLLFGTN